jgi:hypothetical protein
MGGMNVKASEFVATIKGRMADAGFEKPSRRQVSALLEDEDLSTPLEVTEVVAEYLESGADGDVRFDSEEWEEFDGALDDVAEKQAGEL